MKKYIGAVAAALALMVMTVSCQHPGDNLPDNVVATVNGDQITVNTFRTYCGGTISDDHGVKKQKLVELFTKMIIYQMAKAKGYETSPEVISLVKQAQDDKLEEMMKYEIAKNVEVADDELPPVPEELGPTFDLNVIISKTLDDARKARERVVGGEKFEDVAKEVSTGPSSVEGGHLGEVPLYSPMFGDGVRAMLNSLDIGEISPVARLQIGYAVFKIDSRKDKVQVVEEYRDNLRRKMLARRIEEAIVKRVLELREESDLVINDTYGQPGGDNSWLATLHGIRIEGDFPSLTEEEKVHLPHANMEDNQIFTALNRNINRILLADEARRIGLNISKEFLGFSWKTELNTANDVYIRNEIWPKSKVTDEEVREYYDTHQDEFRLPAKVRLQRILVNDEALAREIKELLDAGADFSRMVAQHSIDKSAKNGGVIDNVIKGNAIEPINTVAFELKEGEHSDVLKTEYGYEIIKILNSREEMVAPYEQVFLKLRKKMENEKKGNLVLEFYDEIEKNADIVINERVMRELKD